MRRRGPCHQSGQWFHHRHLPGLSSLSDPERLYPQSRPSRQPFLYSRYTPSDPLRSTQRLSRLSHQQHRYNRYNRCNLSDQSRQQRRRFLYSPSDPYGRYNQCIRYNQSRHGGLSDPSRPWLLWDRSDP